MKTIDGDELQKKLEQMLTLMPEEGQKRAMREAIAACKAQIYIPTVVKQETVSDRALMDEIADLTAQRDRLEELLFRVLEDRYGLRREKSPGPEIWKYPKGDMEDDRR